MEGPRHLKSSCKYPGNFFSQFALSFFGSILFIFSCNQPVEKKPAGKNQKTTNAWITPAVIKPKLATVNYKFHPQRKETPWKGNIAATANWIDANGNNVIIISVNESGNWRQENPQMEKFAREGDNCGLAELFAYHYFFNDSSGKWKLKWALNDFEFSCTDTDLMYFKGSLTISDVDSNGIAESCFAYYENYNVIDLNYTIKLISHVNSTKLKVYGGIGEYKYILKEWNEKLLTPEYSKSFDSIAPVHRKYAEKMWNVYSKQQDSLDKLQLKEWGFR